MSKQSQQDRPLPVGLIIKLNFLILGLLLVVFFIYRLNSAGLPSGLRAMLGMPTDGKSKLTWCETRVKAMSFNDGSGLQQIEYRWVGHNGKGAEADLNFIGVEKWLGQNCTVTVQDARPAGGAGTEDALGTLAMEVHFIDGQTRSFYELPDGSYRWDDKVFKSPELSQQLTALRDMLP